LQTAALSTYSDNEQNFEDLLSEVKMYRAAAIALKHAMTEFGIDAKI
jgi:hypothetical protein